MVPSNLAWVIPLKYPSDHTRLLLNPFTGSFSPIITISDPKSLEKMAFPWADLPQANQIPHRIQDKLWSVLNSYSTSSKTTPSSPSLPSSQYIVGCNKSIGPKPHLRTSDPQTRVRTPLMPTRKVLSEWIRQSLHPYLLSLTSCSSRWSHTPCNFILPCLYPYYFFCLEYPSLPSCLCLPGLPNKLLFIL